MDLIELWGFSKEILRGLRERESALFWKWENFEGDRDEEEIEKIKVGIDGRWGLNKYEGGDFKWDVIGFLEI